MNRVRRRTIAGAVFAVMSIAVGSCLLKDVLYRRSYDRMMALIAGTGNPAIRSVEFRWKEREAVFDDEPELAFWKRALSQATLDGPLYGGRRYDAIIRMDGACVLYGYFYLSADKEGAEVALWPSYADKARISADPEGWVISLKGAPDSVVRGLAAISKD